MKLPIFHRSALASHFLRPRLLAIILAGFALNACDVVNEIIKEPPPPPCPTVSILGNAERITLFRDGPGRDLTDVTAEARIDDFIAKCLYDVDEETGAGKIDVEISLGITAARGAANTQGAAEIPYFVTITDLDKAVLSKNLFRIIVPFKGNQYSLTAYDNPVVLTVPITPPQTGREYLIYIGFQLTPDQLEYNRLLRQSGS